MPYKRAQQAASQKSPNFSGLSPFFRKFPTTLVGETTDKRRDTKFAA